MLSSAENLVRGALLVVLLFIGGTTFPSSSKPRLYSKLDRYFRTLDHHLIDSAHNKTLRALKATITGSAAGDRNLAILFTCPDNAFRSQAAQIILESLVKIRHLPYLKVFSAGYDHIPIDQRLLQLLAKKGFIIISPADAKDKMEPWLIKFSNELAPLTIFSKSLDDPSLPSSIYHLIKTCTRTEPECTDRRGALFTSELPFENPGRIRDDRSLEREFDTIAGEIYSTFMDAIDPINN